ncbi:MAG: hypothetical protein AAF035_06325 [Pseudomonadota bacterium]
MSLQKGGRLTLTSAFVAALAVSALTLPSPAVTAALASDLTLGADGGQPSQEAFGGYIKAELSDEDVGFDANSRDGGRIIPQSTTRSRPAPKKALTQPKPLQPEPKTIAKDEKRLPFIDEDVPPVIANAPIPAPRPVIVTKRKAPKRGSDGQKVDTIKTASTSKCIPATKARDRDIRRNAKYLAGACIQKHIVKDGSRTWTIFQIGKGGAPHYPILHDDENAAFSAAARVSRGTRGTIWAVETGERRGYKGQDPNRNFGNGSCRNQRGSNGAFSRFLMGKMRSGKIIAVHSNANSFAGGGGRGNISIRRKSTVLQGFPARNAKGGFRDEDNFILVPGRASKPKGRALSKIRSYNRRGINAMYEYVRGRGDCSLSNYLALKGQAGRYVNVEVQDGQTGMAVQLIRSAK